MVNDMLRLLIVFFIGMFCKLQNMRWPCNVTTVICCRRCLQCLVKIAETTLHLWHPLKQCYKKMVLLMLSKISPHQHDISQLTYPLLLLVSEVPEAAVCRCSSE